MKYLTAFGLLLLPLLSSAQALKINPGKYFDYYHMRYQLQAGKYKVNRQYGFNPGGQFEVLVPKQYFPIPAPNCNSNIIIRMPYSNNEAKKRALYDALLASETLSVVLELNPYFNLLEQEPLQLELQYCNVFFRHRGGDYYDQL